MKKRALITCFGLEIGGVERSLIGLLCAMEDANCDVDLFLYSCTGELISQVPSHVNLLPEVRQYSYFQKSLLASLGGKGGRGIVLAKTLAKLTTLASSRMFGRRGSYMTRAFYYSLPFLPRIAGSYDLAISFLAPHYCVLNRVKAQKKVGWVHTDYARLECGVDVKFESSMWEELDIIAAVSQDVRKAFTAVFPRAGDKVIVVENVLSPEFIRRQATQEIAFEMPDEKGVVRLCTVGRFSYAKGWDLAIAACRNLLDMGYNIKWYAVGSGLDEPMMRRMIEDHRLTERFLLLGKKVNPYPHMRACDIYVQPSRYEGKAVSVREAQILGKPVVITAFPTAGSQLENGVDGHITPLSVDGIVDGVARMIDNAEWRNRLALNTLSRDYSNRHEVDKIYALL